MFIPGQVAFRRISLAISVFFLGFNPPIAAAQNFAISAAPATTSPLGTGFIQYTVSGIPFSGSLIISCEYAGAASFQAQAKLPICGIGPIVAFNVTPGQTVTGTMSLVPWGSPIPLALHHASHGMHRMLASGFLFVGVVLFGLRLRDRRRWTSLLLVVLGALAIASGFSACGGSSTAAPGTYPYTMTATLNSTSPAILTVATSTTTNVTVP